MNEQGGAFQSTHASLQPPDSGQFVKPIMHSCSDSVERFTKFSAANSSSTVFHIRKYQSNWNRNRTRMVNDCIEKYWISLHTLTWMSMFFRNTEWDHNIFNELFYSLIVNLSIHEVLRNCYFTDSRKNLSVPSDISVRDWNEIFKIKLF